MNWIQQDHSCVIVSKNKETLTQIYTAVLYIFIKFSLMLIKSSCHLIIERADSIDVSRCKLLETTSQVSREQVCELLGLIQKKLGFIGICTAFFQNSGEGPDNWEKLVSLLGGHQVGIRERENT